VLVGCTCHISEEEGELKVMNTPDNLGPDMSMTDEFALPGRGLPPAPRPEAISSNGAGPRSRVARRPAEPASEEQSTPPAQPRSAATDRPGEPATPQPVFNPAPPDRAEQPRYEAAPYEAPRSEGPRSEPASAEGPAPRSRRHAAGQPQSPDELLSQVPSSMAEHPLLLGLLAELPPPHAAPPPAYLDQWLEATRAVLELLYARASLNV